MAKRSASIRRETKETKVVVRLTLEGSGKSRVKTGIGMLDHLLAQLARHSLFDITISASGDVSVDQHHLVEDIAIVMGQAFSKALGERRGIRRMAHAFVPMDEALAFVAVDIGGRGYPVVEGLTSGKVGELRTDLLRHFLETLALETRMNLHARIHSGVNEHHIAEALFKALGRALDVATQIDERIAGDVPSTKGVISDK
ncbi:MAG: imidazoleglycerol-phosphate dehydratase HisB [Chloroflexi bacterium]|nr:imidazoleglycerol-phosphate dehydratase HisB [Chloroflexota bacterium]